MKKICGHLRLSAVKKTFLIDNFLSVFRNKMLQKKDRGWFYISRGLSRILLNKKTAGHRSVSPRFENLKKNFKSKQPSATPVGAAPPPVTIDKKAEKTIRLHIHARIYK